MICLTQQNGHLFWLAVHHILGMEVSINGTHVFYSKNCITVKETPREILAKIP
jgi:uncharacterized protein YlzI (FlbEa/FlbD family)